MLTCRKPGRASREFFNVPLSELQKLFVTRSRFKEELARQDAAEALQLAHRLKGVFALPHASERVKDFWLNTFNQSKSAV